MFSQSQTLVSTLKECYNLRNLGLWAFLLVGLWSFSPAGGQAVLRLLTIEDNYLTASQDLAYYPRHNLSWSAGNNGLSGATSQRVYWQMLLGTALSAPGAEVLLANGSSEGFEDAINRLSLPAAISGTRQDMWGNVRIPTLHLLPGYDENSPEQWVDVPTDSIVEVESLVGVPIRGIRDTGIGNVTFEISASYNLFEVSNSRSSPALPSSVYHSSHFDSARRGRICLGGLKITPHNSSRTNTGTLRSLTNSTANSQIIRPFS